MEPQLDELQHYLNAALQREDLRERITMATRSLSDPESILEVSARLLGEHLGVNRCVYAAADPNRDTFTLFGNYTHGVDPLAGTYAGEQFGNCFVELMQRGENFIVEDCTTDPRLADSRDIFLATGMLAEIAVPIRKDGALSAVLAVHSAKPRKWLPEEVRLVASVANRCWESIERTRAIRDLQLNQQRLRLSQQAGNSGTFDWLIQEGKILWTPELEALYGVPTGTFEGSFADWVKRVVPEDSERVSAEIQQVLERRQRDYGYDFRAILPSGEQRWLHGQAHFYYAEDGTPTRMIGINSDIHQRRLAEETLLRTEKLAAVGRLAASIAHEINNPLESVTNLLFLARSSENLNEVRSLLETADAELRRASAITSQTLRFHRQSTSPQEVDTTALVEEILNVYQGRLHNSGAELSTRLRAKRPLRCFDGEIRQVLANLIANAIDAMSGSKGRLLIRTREATRWPSEATGKPAERGIVFTVADTGSGIPPTAARRLFEPFFTTKGTTGTGLGLWVSKEIVIRHRGALRLRSSQSSRHRGTVFTIFLPFDAATR